MVVSHHAEPSYFCFSENLSNKYSGVFVSESSPTPCLTCIAEDKAQRYFLFIIFFLFKVQLYLKVVEFGNRLTQIISDIEASLSDAYAVTCWHLSLPAWVYLSALREAMADFPWKLIYKQRLRKKLSGRGICFESFHMMSFSYRNHFCLVCARTDLFLSYEKGCTCFILLFDPQIIIVNLIQSCRSDIILHIFSVYPLLSERVWIWAE